MKTLNEQIERLRELVRKCYGVVVSKGGEIPEAGERTMENLPNAIESVPQEVMINPLKVKVNTLRISPNFEGDNGVWDASVIDTSEMTSANNIFNGCNKLKEADISTWDLNKVTAAQMMFQNSTITHIDLSNAGMNSLKDLRQIFSASSAIEINVSNWNFGTLNYSGNTFIDSKKTENIKGLETWIGKKLSVFRMFENCHKLKGVGLLPFDTSITTSIKSTFNSCFELDFIDITSWELNNATETTYAFYRCSKLYTIIGNRTLDDVIENNISVLKGLKVGIDLHYTILDRASLRAVINGLADLTGQTAQTLTIGATLIAKLTEEDIAIAVSKNWTIA